MARQYRKFDHDFQQGAVRLVFETGKPIAQVARELGINAGTLGNWCAPERRRRDGGDPALREDEHAELERVAYHDHTTRNPGSDPTRPRRNAHAGEPDRSGRPSADAGDHGDRR